MFRVGDDAFEQRPVVGGHARDRLCLEQVAVIFEPAVKPFRRLRQVERQIELRRAGINLDGRQRQVGHPKRQRRSVLEDEESLEQWVMTQVTIRL